MALDRLTKITGPGIKTDTNWEGNNANFSGVTTTASSFNVGVTTIHSTLIEAHNIKSTGIITATGGSFSGNVTAVDGTFSGNVSIAGTLTYEDVTNIDSVGIITAPALDIDDFLDVGSNIKLGNAGVITATSFVGSGAALTGIDATAIKDSGGNVKIQAQASGAIHSGIHTFSSGAEVGSNIKFGNAGVVTATSFTGSGANLTSLPAGQLTGTVADARISTLTASKLSGALPAISGANLTNLPAQATIANNADNRVITGGSGVNLNGESNLTFNGSLLNVSARIACDVNSDIDMSQSADGQLVIGGNGYTSAIALNDEGMQIYHNSASRAIIFGTNENERLRITSGGQVNIGGNYAETSHPFNISHSTKPSLALHTGTTLRADLSATTGITSIRSYANSPFTVNIGGSGETEALRINSNGQIGIGTDTMDSSAEVSIVNPTSSSRIYMKSSNSSDCSLIFGAMDDAATGAIRYDHSDDSLRFMGYNNSERLRITSDGHVLIGTSSGGLATGDEFVIHTAGHTGMTIRSGSSSEGNIFFGDSDYGAAGIIRYEHNNNAMVFKTNSTGQERLRIDSSGNILCVARGVQSSLAPFFLAVTGQGTITYGGSTNDTACLRIEDKGSNDGYYHGLEMRTKRGGDVRVYAHDQGNDLADLVIATDNSALLERARFTQYGLHLQPYTTDSANSGYPISTFTDGGTRFATHLATMSGYSGDGEIIVITNFSDHSGGSEMFSVRITGYWYSSNVGGAIDCVVGAYAGENSYYNPTVTGTYPLNWRDKIKFASITSGNNQGKMCIRLGAVGSANDCELAFTDCTHGFYGVNQSKTSGWRVIKVNDQSVINNTYNGTTTTAIHRSNEIYNDEFQVLGSGTGELLTNRVGRGGTIMGMYQYTQYNQGQNFNHLIRSPHGHTNITDQYANQNWTALITVGVDGTSTVDTACTYFCRDNSDDNDSLQIYHHLGNSGSSSNRCYMENDGGRPAWKMNHPSAYRISVTVQFIHGGKGDGTYNTSDTSYQGN